MFVLRLTNRLASCIDLVVDAATLGEYGLEPAAPVAAAEACAGRQHTAEPIGPQLRGRAGGHRTPGRIAA